MTEVPGCEIRALASVPDFSPVDLGSVEEEGSPLVNRGFSAYAPGSVFKLVTAAALLEECFPHAYSGELARQQMELCVEEGRVSLMAWEEVRLLGFVGAMPQYGVTAWELHPLAVTAARRGEGIGAALVAALEREVAARGCLTLYLGTDDEFFQTSLSQGDLFEDTFEKIQNIRNLARHPYEFYQKQGFQIVGVLPDANGPGKPDIWMAKRVTARDKSRTAL